MKKLFFSLLLCPLLSTAQRPGPRFEHDTLYTSGGYKIYKGQVLQLANGTEEAGYFRFIKFHYGMNRNDTYILQNSSILVTNVRGFKNPSAGNYNIRIDGMATYKNNSKAEVVIIMDFERAIESPDGSPSELTVAEEFRRKRAETAKEEVKKQPVVDERKDQTVNDDLKKLMVADEIKKLFDLYKAGALTKAEYEAQKKKLLERQ